MKKSLFITGALSLAIFLSACGNGEKADENADVKQKDEEVSTETETAENEPVMEEEKEQADGTAVIATHDFFEPFQGNLEHVHGLGYAGNQNAIFFASHDGLRVYENGKWFKTKELNNDYMGFNAVDQGFYTSGHPGPGVDLPNPLGLKRSFDNGQTLEDLGFEGESDFHVMGVGFNNHTVYVLNGHKNSKMGEGLYVSRDDGKSWAEVKADYLGEKIFSIAVHPTNDQLVAASGQEGIFLSKDGGNRFSLLDGNKQGTAIFFSEDALWYGAYGKEASLVKYSLDNGDNEELNLPKMEKDAVMYVAQNPQNKSEIVFVTFNGSIYLSDDEGNSWKPLVVKGEI